MNVAKLLIFENLRNLWIQGFDIIVFCMLIFYDQDKNKDEIVALENAGIHLPIYQLSKPLFSLISYSL